MENLVRRVTPAVLGLAVFVFGLTSPNTNPVAFFADGYTAYHFAPLAIAAALCGVAAAYGRRTLWPLLVATAIGWSVHTLWPALMVCSYYAAIHLTKRSIGLLYAGVATAAVVVPGIIGMDMRNNPGAGFVLGSIGAGVLVLLPYALGLYARARRQILGALRERAERAEREQAAHTDRARAEERARIAREMHDVVAHRVALMVLHAGAMEVNAPDERSAAEAALIRTTGREALGELRQVLGVLRGDSSADTDLKPQPDLSDVESLLSRTRAAGLPVELVQDGEPRQLPAVVQRTAYRVIQEALTNVVKHNGSVPTVVVLSYQSSTFDVRVENAAPPGPVERLPGSGLGLVGLRERVALLYGRFEAQQRLDGGFVVHAVLPGGAQEVPA